MRIFVIKRRTIMIFSAILAGYLAVMTVIFGGYGGITAAISPKKKIPIYCVDKTEKVIAISFDAGWGNEDTQQLIDILAKYKVKATFFLVGTWVDSYPESVKALFEAGHEIMNHSNKHKNMPALSKQGIIEDIEECNKKIEAITGVRPTLFRPPSGAYNNTLIDAVAGINMYTIQWDVDSHDWMKKSKEYIIDRVTKRVKPGSIVLFHNAAENTPEALPDIIETLLADGYKFVPISELIYKDNYTIDHTGRQISSADKPR